MWVEPAIRVMDALGDLLVEAARWRWTLLNPSAMPTGHDALDAVRGYLAVEDRILALPSVEGALAAELEVPLDITSGRPNHALLAGLVIARAGFPSSAAALLAAAGSPHAWCAEQAQRNLGWLARAPAIAARLRVELTGGASPVAAPILADALLHQRREEDLPEAVALVADPRVAAPTRAWLLTGLVCQLPERGLSVAAERGPDDHPIVRWTAVGLRAVYGDEPSFNALLDGCDRAGEGWDVALRWVGRVPRPESMPRLLAGLRHPHPVVRADVVTSLAWIGAPPGLAAVADALEDPAREVTQQAMTLLFDWATAQPDFDRAREWHYEEDGRLDPAGRRDLSRLLLDALAALPPGLRYRRGQPLVPLHLLEELYRGVLPDHTWFHWVAMTGAALPYTPRKDVLYNFPSLELAEDWHLAHGASFGPGGWSYQGRAAG